MPTRLLSDMSQRNNTKGEGERERGGSSGEEEEEDEEEEDTSQKGSGKKRRMWPGGGEDDGEDDDDMEEEEEEEVYEAEDDETVAEIAARLGPSYCYIRVHILLLMCPLTTTYVSSCYQRQWRR